MHDDYIIVGVDVRVLKFLLNFGIFTKEDFNNLIKELSKVSLRDFNVLVFGDSMDKNVLKGLRYKIKSSKYSSVVLQFLKACNDVNLGGNFQTFLYADKKIKDLGLIYDYISSDSIDVEDFMKRLDKLEELGFNEFDYSPFSNLDDIYSGKIYHSCGIDDIEWVYSDGKREYLTKTANLKYKFRIIDAKYVIYNRKTKFWRKNDNLMVIKDFNFDIDSLPTKAELWDNEIKPNIDLKDERRLDNKNAAIDRVYSIENNQEALKRVLGDLRNILKDVDLYESSSIVLKRLNYSLDTADEVQDYIDELLKVLIDKYSCDGIIEKEELKKGVVKKRRLEKSKKIYKYGDVD